MREVTKPRIVSKAACFQNVIGFLEPLHSCFVSAASRSALAARSRRVLGCPKTRRAESGRCGAASDRNSEISKGSQPAQQRMRLQPTPRRSACAPSAVCWAAMDVWLRVQGRIVGEDVLGFITLPSRRQRNPGFEGRRDYHHGWPPARCFMISVVTVGMYCVFCIAYHTDTQPGLFRIPNTEYRIQQPRVGPVCLEKSNSSGASRFPQNTYYVASSS